MKFNFFNILKIIKLRTYFSVIMLFLFLQFFFRIRTISRFSELIGFTIGQLLLSIIIVCFFGGLTKLKVLIQLKNKKDQIVPNEKKKTNQILPTLIVFLLILQPFGIITNAQDTDIIKHKLQFEDKNWFTKTDKLEKSKNFKFQQVLSQISNPSEKIEINYIDKDSFEKNDLIFYEKVQEKKLLIERSKDVIYSIDGIKNDRVTFYNGDDTFLRCFDSPFKKLNNNWYSIEYDNNLYFVKSKNAILNYIPSGKKEYSLGIFQSIKVKDVYSICLPSVGYYAFRDDSIKNNFYYNFFESIYFSSGLLGDDYTMIKANLTAEYKQTFASGSTDNNYDRLINGLSTSDYEQITEIRSAQAIQQDLYSQNTIVLELHKSCNSDLYLKRSQIPPPILIYNNSPAIQVIGLTKSIKVQYKIWYDTCLMYGVKKETLYKEGFLENTDNSIQIIKNNYNVFGDDVIYQTGIENNPLNYNLINKVSSGDKLYSKNKIQGVINVDLEQIGIQSLKFDTYSDKSNIISYDENSILGTINSVTKGLVRGLGSIITSVGESVNYFTKPEEMKTGKTIANSLGLISSFTGTAATAMALTGIGLPIAGVLGTVSVVTGLAGLGVSLALNNSGEIEKDVNKLKDTVTNNLTMAACTEYGTSYDATTNTTQITDWAYCIGNVGSIVAIAKGGSKAYSKIEAKNLIKSNKSISNSFKTLDDYDNQVNKGTVPDKDGNLKPKDNSPQLLNPDATKPLSIILQEDIQLIKASIKSGVNKLDDISGLSKETKLYLQEFIDLGEDIFDCNPVIGGKFRYNTDQYSIANKSSSIIGIHLASLDNSYINNNNLYALVCNQTSKIEYLTKHRQSIIDSLNNNQSRFKSSVQESLYKVYVALKTKSNQLPRSRFNWHEERLYWTEGSPIARGNRFNKLADEQDWYRFNEVYLDNGKYLDGYNPPSLDLETRKKISGKIVSRKASDLDIIGTDGLVKHIKELKTKYAIGRIIKSKKPGSETIFDTRLEGDYYIELPESNLSLPDIKIYEKIAKDNNVTLIYKPEK